MNSKLAILLVEDDALDVIVFERAINDLEIKCDLAIVPTGEAAITWLTEHANSQPSIILMDLNMPRMGGLELLAVLKEHSIWRSIPVIVLTTSNQSDERQQCFELSVAGYIIKPMDYQAFVEIVRAIYAYWHINALTN